MAREWIESVENTEVADILCHRLLRYCDFAWQLCREYASAELDLQRYTALRLAADLHARSKLTNRETNQNLEAQLQRRPYQLPHSLEPDGVS